MLDGERALIGAALRDARVSTSAAGVLAWLVVSRSIGTDAPRPLKLAAIASILRRDNRTVAHCVAQLVGAGYLRVAGRDGRFRLFMLPDAPPPDAAHHCSAPRHAPAYARRR